MNRLTKIRNHPFPLLLYLEWILLSIALLTEFLGPAFFKGLGFPVLTALNVIGLGLMGVRLPTGKPIYKILYTALEFALILSMGETGRRGFRLFPFLYLVVVIRSCLVFKLPGRLAVTGLAFVSFLLTLLYRIQNANIPVRPAVQERFRFVVLNLTVNSALLFGLILVLVLLLVNTLLAERQSREKLAKANEQLRRYALRIEDLATLQERNRIARDIHDSLGHSLTALNIQLEGAVKLWPTNPTQAQAFLAEAKRLGSTALREVRQSVSTLRANPLQNQSLDVAIASLAQDCQRTTGITPNCQISLTAPVPIEVATTVYRIVQEALTNICKYANATEVNIQIAMTPKQLHLTIQDNGQGFDVHQNKMGFGLQGMQERALALEGICEINSQPGAGCQIVVQLPFTQGLD